jgi:hypothetical protein
MATSLLELLIAGKNYEHNMSFAFLHQKVYFTSFIGYIPNFGILRYSILKYVVLNRVNIELAAMVCCEF